MRKLFYLTQILNLCYFSSAFAQNTTNPKCLETKYIFIRNGTAETKIARTFDAKGNILTETEVISSKYRGYYTNETIYEYDEKGNNTQIIEKTAGNIVKTIKKDFDATGKAIKENVLNGNTSFTQTNLKANESEQIYYESDGKTESIREKKTFDNAGNLLKKETIGKDGKATMIDEKVYDGKGNILKYSNIDAVANVTHTTDYVYDNQGKILSDKTLRNEVVFAETKYEYSQNGQLTKKIRLNGQGKEEYYFIYEYNQTTQLSKETYFYNNQIITYQVYEYDANGNKIKESFFDTKGNLTSLKEWEFKCNF